MTRGGGFLSWLQCCSLQQHSQRAWLLQHRAAEPSACSAPGRQQPAARASCGAAGRWFHGREAPGSDLPLRGVPGTQQEGYSASPTTVTCLPCRGPHHSLSKKVWEVVNRSLYLLCLRRVGKSRLPVVCMNITIICNNTRMHSE